MPILPHDVVFDLRRSRTGSLLGGAVLGVGSAVPDLVVTNDDLAKLGCDADWIVQRTGIRERRHLRPGETTSDLAVAAARRCLEAAHADPADVDLVLVATVTPDMPTPSTASLVQDRLGIRAPAFDLNAACAGFTLAWLSGMQWICSGCSRRALVIGVDCHSRVVDPTDPKIYPLFGDGAGAVLLGTGQPDQGFLAYSIGSDGSGASVLYRAIGGAQFPFPEIGVDDRRRFLQMDGRAVFKWAVRMLEATIRQTLDTAGRTIDDVDLFVLHQANDRILKATTEQLNIDPAKMFVNLDRYGNTAAASVPLALDEALQAGRLKRGDLVMTSGFGAGLAWGTALVRW